MKKSTKRLLSLMLSLILVVGLIPGSLMTAHAAAGDGESDPLYVTTFAELKTALEKPADTYIVVNSFATSNTDANGIKYYNLNDDYTVAGASAISIPAGYTKTLVVNTTIDCRASHLSRHLSCFISNAGNLTIMGNGTINCGFNVSRRGLEYLSKNSVIYNTGTLTVKENPTLTTLNSDVTCARRAIWNAGTATIEGGTFVGCCDIPNETQGSQVIDDCYAVLNDGTMTIKGGTFEAYTIRTGKTAYGLYSVNTNLSIYDGVFNGIESNTTMAREETDEPISSFLVSGYEYRKMTDDTVFDGSSISETGESLYVAPIGSVKHSITVSDGSASHTKAFAGTMVTLTANAAPDGMVFDKWEVVSGGVTIEDNKFEMPNADVEIKAVYKAKTFTITVSAEPSEGGVVTVEGTYLEGTPASSGTY